MFYYNYYVVVVFFIVLLIIFAFSITFFDLFLLLLPRLGKERCCITNHRPTLSSGRANFITTTSSLYPYSTFSKCPIIINISEKRGLCLGGFPHRGKSEGGRKGCAGGLPVRGGRVGFLILLSSLSYSHLQSNPATVHYHLFQCSL